MKINRDQRPLPCGTKCEQPNGCEGVEILSTEELRAPATCVFCRKIICDICIAGLTNIPPTAFEPHAPPSNKQPSGHYDGWACSDCFNEDWI